MCWDPFCTVAEVWCCSEYYLWLFEGGFLVGAYTAMYYYRAVFFMKLLNLRKLAVCKLDLSRGVLLGVIVLDHGLNLHTIQSEHQMYP